MQARANIDAKTAELSHSLGSNLIGILSVFLMGALVLGASGAAENVRRALSLCVTSVIPSVFPLMVISNALALGRGGDLLELFFGSAVRKIFGVSPRATVAVILGFVCGAPVGATAAARLCESGDISKNDLERLMTFINNPSAAFVIYAVGGGMLGSSRLGLVIYLCVITSSVIVGIISPMTKKGGMSADMPPKRPDQPISSLIVRSVSSAIFGSLNICAYAAFFSSAVGILSDSLGYVGVPDAVRAALFGIFELIGGTRALSCCNGYYFSVTAIAAACSWSGISILMQVVAVCRSSAIEGEISFLPMLVSKLLQTVISSSLIFIYLYTLG